MLGTHLNEDLSVDHRVITAGRSSSADVRLHLESPDLPAAPTFDVAVICAASFRGEDPEGMISNETVNGLGPLRVAAIGRTSGCRHIVFISSVTALEGPAGLTSYGLSKRHGQENLALFCDTHEITYTALQFTQLYDATGEAQRHQPFLYAMLRAGIEGRDITLNGSANPYRNYLFADDAVALIRRVIEQRMGGIYPCVHPESHRISEVAQLALDVCGKGGRTRWDPTQSNIPSIPLSDDHRVYEHLRYAPRVHLRDGMEMIRDRMNGE